MKSIFSKRMIFALCIVFIFIGSAHAQAPMQSGIIDGILKTYKTQAASWQNSFKSFALHTFFMLAGIEMTWAAIKLAFRNCDMSELLAEVLNQILTLGFFLAVLENAVNWSSAIVNGFRYAAGLVGKNTMDPADVFDAGIQIAAMIMSKMSLLHMESSAGLIVAGTIILACFALMAALMVLTLVESYLVISMGTVFLAFGASAWTRDIAVSVVRYCASVGAKLFVLQLLISTGGAQIIGWAKNFNDVTDINICIVIGSSIVMLALVKTLPDTIQNMMNGSSASSLSAIAGAAMQVADNTGAIKEMVQNSAANAAGGGATMWQATKLASEQNKDMEPGAGKAAKVFSDTMKNVGGAMASEAGRRMRGDINSQHGFGSWRMANDLKQQRVAMADLPPGSFVTRPIPDPNEPLRPKKDPFGDSDSIS